MTTESQKHKLKELLCSAQRGERGASCVRGNFTLATGHPIIASFEPGEDWFYDYETQGMSKGVELLPPHSHPEDQPVPGPAGRVPVNWESLLH